MSSAVFGVIFGLLLLVLVLQRWSRWLAFVQQKEYRLDRLLAWLSTREGQAEWWRIVPSLQDFSSVGWKRPRPTARVVMVAFFSGLGIVLLLGAGLWLGVWGLLAVCTLLYLSIPPLVLVGTLPTAAIVEWQVKNRLNQASNMLYHGQAVVIGIGGCYGKTSTKLLLHTILNRWKPTFTTPHSYNNRYSVATSIINSYQGESIALLEFGTYKRGEIAELANYFPPKIGIETGFTEQHLQLFGSLENIFGAEGELAAALPADAPIFCHAADPGAWKIAEVGSKESGATIIPYTGDHQVVSLQNITLDQKGQLSFSYQGMNVKTKLVGRHYSSNIQGAVAVAEHLGVPLHLIREGLEAFEPNERFVRSFEKGSMLIVDDGYSSNPAGFQAALELAQELIAKRSIQRFIVAFAGIVDLGQMSDRIHLQLAQQLSGMSAEVWYVGQVGKAEFTSVLGKNAVTAQNQVIHRLEQIVVSDSTLILIEGRLPAYMQQQIMQKVQN